MHWAAIVFGWPFATIAIVVSAIGLFIRRAGLVWAGALIGLPFMFYIFGTPRFWWMAAIAAPCHFGAAAAASRQQIWLGFLLFIPTPVVTLVIAAAIGGSMG